MRDTEHYACVVREDRIGISGPEVGMEEGYMALQPWTVTGSRCDAAFLAVSLRLGTPEGRECRRCRAPHWWVEEVGLACLDTVRIPGAHTKTGLLRLRHVSHEEDGEKKSLIR